jgi:hypothetical protein
MPPAGRHLVGDQRRNETTNHNATMYNTNTITLYSAPVTTTHKVVVSTSIPVRFDSTAFKEAHPSLYEEFKRQGSPTTSARIHGR